MAGCKGSQADGAAPVASGSAEQPAALVDSSNGDDWALPGRTFGEQHYSPLTQVSAGTVGRLGLAWSLDLPVANSVTQPIEVGGVLYFASGLSRVQAVDVETGRQLWSFDPKVAEAPGRKLRLGWGSRGVAWWNDKIYVGTLDGRLIAVDAKTGKQVWSVMTTGQDDGRYITGAPRVFGDKVIIGHGGADVASIRGYVTTYDAETGKQLWRFYTVPGNPADGFENKAMEMAAKTWSGEWWQYGGGGTVWNAMTYDPESDTIMLGTGNGSPWNHKIRSAGKGDNLFLCSVVALDAKTGAYKWHYQFNPGESWDYNAAMDMQLADLKIDGQLRKVLITAPKNGFLYVIDRTNGRFISAKPYVKTTWAKSVDPKTGRPVDTPNNRYEKGTFVIAPGPGGAHNWLPMAFSKATGLVYINAVDQQAPISNAGSPKTWKRGANFQFDGGAASLIDDQPGKDVAFLIAWDPVTQKQVWRNTLPGNVSGGVVATAGDLLFQGTMAGQFKAYSASTGKTLWSFDAHAPVMAPPITYSVAGRQFVTVLTGAGSSLVLLGANQARFGIGYREQARRVLTFALGAKAALPASPKYVFKPVDDPDYRPNPAMELRGAMAFGVTCLLCHGKDAVGSGVAPDLRASPAILDADTYRAITRDGALLGQGMPRFNDMSGATLEDLRQYVRSQAAIARQRGGNQARRGG